MIYKELHHIDDATCIIFLTRGLYLRRFSRNAIG